MKRVTFGRILDLVRRFDLHYDDAPLIHKISLNQTIGGGTTYKIRTGAARLA